MKKGAVKERKFSGENQMKSGILGDSRHLVGRWEESSPAEDLYRRNQSEDQRMKER